MSKADERDEDKIRKGIGQAEYVKKGTFGHSFSCESWLTGPRD